ncbi:D-Ala-D-Ala carboxypeptidase family metallohydrolase [Tenacibaculum maritimum]
MKLTKNFHISEFLCKDGSYLPFDVRQNVLELAENLQVIRDYIGKPIHINSAYRSVSYNKKIGGVPNSQHIYGKAADITVKGLSSRKLARIIRKLIRKGKIKQGGVGLYDGFVHYDIRGYEACWDYSSLFNW